jgi:TRAP-type uncharacterized transport system fused permease subunit
MRTAALPLMFIFNTDILLIGINNFFEAVFIFIMTCIGTCAFAAATQGWFIAKNRWYDLLGLAVVCGFMFRPHFFAGLLGIEESHLAYMLGAGLFAALYFLQKLRSRRLEPVLA